MVSLNTQHILVQRLVIYNVVKRDSWKIQEETTPSSKLVTLSFQLML